MKRLEAFTLMEMAVTMLIAGIVISMAYTAFGIINRSYQHYRTHNDEMATMIRMDELLEKDFSSAVIIKTENNSLLLKDSIKTTVYNFSGNYLIRVSGVADTFKVEVSDIRLFFEKQKVDSLSATDEDSRVDELTFSLLYKDEKIPYHYHKLYSSENLINRNPNAIH